MKNFKSRISKRSEKLNSQLIFALDLSLSLYSLDKAERKTKREELFQQALSTLKAVEEHVAAVVTAFLHCPRFCEMLNIELFCS